MSNVRIILSHFVEFSRQNTKMYGDITAKCTSDKDLALMLKEIIKLGNKLQSLLEIYSEEQLVSFNRNWPLPKSKNCWHHSRKVTWNGVSYSLNA